MEQKYLKYKAKYLKTKNPLNQYGGNDDESKINLLNGRSLERRKYT